MDFLTSALLLVEVENYFVVPKAKSEKEHYHQSYHLQEAQDKQGEGQDN